MKVLLIQSYFSKQSIPVFPLGLSYIANALDGHEVIGFDPNTEENCPEKIERLIKEFKPDVIGISLRNIWPYDDQGIYSGVYYEEALIPLLRLIKRIGDQKIVIGGPGFTAYAHEILEYAPEIDYGVFRDGEETFARLLENLDHPEKAKGIFYRKNGDINFTGAAELENFDSLPMPRRDIFNIDKYRVFTGSMGVQSKRGCALRCAYCVYPYLCGNRVYLRSHVKVVDEIEYLSNTYNIKDIVFVDTVFNIPSKHAEQICRELVKRRLDIKWTAWFYPKYMTEEFMKLAIESGCYLFEFSPDAYSNKTLHLLKKNIEKSDITKTYRLAKKITNANVHYNFFVNAPGETIFTFLQLLFFYVRAKVFLGRKLKRFIISHLHIEPNTEIYRLALKRGLIDQKTKFLGSREIYEKMLYRNSMLVEKIFKLLSKTKKTLKSVLNVKEVA